MKNALLFFCLCLLSAESFGQSKRAFKHYQEARAHYRADQWAEALEHLDKAIDKDPEFADPALMAGQICMELEDHDRAEDYFDQAWIASKKAYIAFQIGMASYSIGHYERARSFFLEYLDREQKKKRLREVAQHRISSCDFALDALKNPQAFEPVNLGPEINTAAMEYFPALSADGQQLVWTYRNPEGHRRDEDFYFSSRVDGMWQPGAAVQGRLNTPFNEGAQCISAAGDLMIFVGCNRPEGKGSCDLYWAKQRKDGRWSEAFNLGDSINTGNWETQPSLSSDGQTLYFIRSKKHDEEQSDIYFSQRRSDGRWSRAQKMPAPINSSGKEASPFIHVDGQTFYFCSSGHVGMGGLDLFVSRKGADGRWSEPENLGHPINSFGEEMGFVIASDGKTAYFSSDMPGGFGLLDIYQVELPEAFRAIPSAWVKGIVRDQQSGRVLAQADLVFTDVHSGEVIHRCISGPDGSFFAVLPAHSDYGLNTDKAGYLFHSAHFALSDQSRERAFELDVPLKPLRSGSRITLENVFFDTDSYALMPESYSELDRLVALMEQNPKLRISLEGHTDSEGSDRGNQLLSERRAASVQAYLVDAGISSDRLEARGYGQSRPIADNSSEEGRQQNRRTELRIL